MYVQESFLNEWPEEPYYEFLLETGTVLRDDQGLAAEVKTLEPSETLRYIGWGRARAFLFLALNKKLLHRAFEVRAVHLLPVRIVLIHLLCDVEFDQTAHAR